MFTKVRITCIAENMVSATLLSIILIIKVKSDKIKQIISSIKTSMYIIKKVNRLSVISYFIKTGVFAIQIHANLAPKQLHMFADALYY